MKIKKKAIWALSFITVSAMLVCIPVFAASSSKTSAEDDRTVKIYRMDGYATVERENAESPSAYTGMDIKSGDTIKVGSNSHLYLKLDGDKYLMAEPGTTFRLEVSGTAKDSRTKVTLVSGSVLSRLDEKLNKNSSYEVVTPNAAVDIRGTVTRQELTECPDGSIRMAADTYEGETGIRASAVKEAIAAADAASVPVVVKAGQSLVVKTDPAGESALVQDEVDYSRLSSDTLQFLADSTVTGRELSITVDELETLAAKKLEQEKMKTGQSGGTSSGGSKDTEDRSDWATDEEPESSGTAEDLPD